MNRHFLGAFALAGAAALSACTPTAPTNTAAPAPSVTAVAPTALPSRQAPSVQGPTSEPAAGPTVTSPVSTPVATPTLNAGVKSIASNAWTGSYGSVRVDVLDSPRLFVVVTKTRAQIMSSVPVAVVNTDTKPVKAAELTDMTVLPLWRSGSPVCAQTRLVSKAGNFCVLFGNTTLGKGFTAPVAPGGQTTGSVSVASPMEAVEGDPAVLKKAAENPDGYVLARKNTTTPALTSCEVVPGFRLAAASVDLGC